MDTPLQISSLTKDRNNLATPFRRRKWGLIGGFAGTLVMDLVLMGALSVVGIPAVTCFAIVGDTVAQCFGKLGLYLAGGVPTGIAAHYLVGPLIGIIFGSILNKVDGLHIASLRKTVLRAVIFTEIMSQPILALTPILLKMSVKDTLIWFGASFVMHFIYGVLLGAMLHLGLRSVKISNNQQ